MSYVVKWSQELTAHDYAVGLSKITPRITVLQRRLLVEQYWAAGRRVTATELAFLANVEGGHPIVNSQYGRLGRLFCKSTGHPPDKRENGTDRLWSVWSTGTDTSDGFVWEMLPAVATALEMLEWVQPEEVRLAEELPNHGGYLEGAVRRITVNAYERDAKARTACIAHYGSTCRICGFDFGAIYGPLADGFIHVHHRKALSEIRTEYRVNPITDLVPVCANCHAILHLGGVTRKIEEVRQLITAAKRQSDKEREDFSE